MRQPGHPTSTRVVVGVVLLMVGASASASAQARPDFLFGRPDYAVSIRGQWNQARADGEIYDFMTEQLTLEPSDFNAPGIALDFGFALNSRVDARVGVDFTSAFSRSEFRDFTDTEDLAIEQDTTLRQVDVFGSLAVALVPRGREIGQYSYVPSRVVPYVGGGGGFLRYELEQLGDFVDFTDLAIFGAQFESAGWTPSAHAFGGVDVRLSPNVYATGEVRYVWAEADLRRDFSGFDPIDLTGMRIGAGVRFVF